MSLDVARLRTESEHLLGRARTAVQKGRDALRRELAARPELEPRRLAAELLARATTASKQVREFVRQTVEEKRRSDAESMSRSHRAGTRR